MIKRNQGNDCLLPSVILRIQAVKVMNFSKSLHRLLLFALTTLTFWPGAISFPRSFLKTLNALGKGGVGFGIVNLRLFCISES